MRRKLARRTAGSAGLSGGSSAVKAPNRRPGMCVSVPVRNHLGEYDRRLRDPETETPPGQAPPPLRRNRDFLLLWTGQVASTVGTRASSVAFPLLVLALTGSPSRAGLVAFAQTLPFPLLFLAAGVVVDRVDRKRLLLVADGAPAGAVPTPLGAPAPAPVGPRPHPSPP